MGIGYGSLCSVLLHGKVRISSVSNMKKSVIGFMLPLALASGLQAQDWQPRQGPDGLYGFVDGSGSFVIEPSYQQVHAGFYKGVACVKMKKGYVFINSQGEAISSAYDWVGDFNDWDLCVVNKGGKTDDYGVLKGGKYGCVGLSGQEVIRPEYDHIGDFNAEGIAVINKGGKPNEYGDFTGGTSGFIHVSGQVKIAPKYTVVGPFMDNGFAYVNVGGTLSPAGECQGGKYGYVNIKGEEIVPPDYSYIGPIGKDGICWTNTGGRLLSADKKAQKLIDAQMRSVRKKTKDVQAIVEALEAIENRICDGKEDVLGNKVTGGKFGFFNVHDVNSIVEPVYSRSAPAFVEGFAWVSQGKKFGYIDKSGRLRVPLRYDKASDFHNGFAIIQNEYKLRMRFGKVEKFLSGYIDSTGREITKIEYAEATPFEYGIARVKGIATYDKKTKAMRGVDKYGFIGTDGKYLADLKYDGVGDYADGIFVCRSGNSLLYVDAKGQEMTPPVLRWARVFQEGVGVIRLSAAEAASNRKGQPIVENTRKPVPKGKAKYGLIGMDGIALTDFVYSQVGAVQEGRIAVMKDGKGGWLDYAGNEVIPLIYDTVSDFYDGLAVVEKDGKWGYVDTLGNTVVPCRYAQASPRFIGGVACVQQSGLFGGISREGKTVIPFLLASEDDFAEILETVYLPGGKRDLTKRDVSLFQIRKKNETKHFGIDAVIPSDYWDF